MDDASERFRAEIEEVVRRHSADDSGLYFQRWKQLKKWGSRRTEGSPTKKSRLKKRLMKESGGRCMDCGREFHKTELEMHRVDTGFACDKTENFGYFEDNVVLLCPVCHDRREDVRRASPSADSGE